MSRSDHRQPEYQAYLLRLWRDDARQSWRASLQSTATGQRFHFGSIDELFAYLDARMGAGNSEHRPDLRSS